MSLVTIIYLVSVVHSFDRLLNLIQIIYLIGLFLVFILVLTNDADERKEFMDEYKKPIKISTIIFCVACFICVFIPTRTEMYAMLAVNQVNSLKLDETAKKGIEALNIKLDEIILESKKD